MSNEVGDMNLDFHNKYPRIWATAESFGFTQEDIEQMIDNEIMLDKYCRAILGNENMDQIALKALMIRLNVGKEQFIKTIKEIANTKSEEDIKKIVGPMQVCVLYALAGCS